MMNKLLLIFATLLFVPGHAQDKFWGNTDKKTLNSAKITARASNPAQYKLLSLNLEGFTAALQNAPLRGSGTVSTVIVPFPDADGNLQHYRVYKAPVLHPDLAAAHPEIQSYAGQGIEHPSSTVRFSITVFGLHAMVLSAGGTVYTDPYTTDKNNYIVYKKSSLQGPEGFSCEIAGEGEEGHTAGRAFNPGFVTMADDETLRTYRLAMACTTEYAAFHISAAGLTNGTLAQQKAAVLAAMNVTMTRVNGVYERDMAVTMQIIPQNEEIIFVTTDNLSNNSSSQLLSQIQNVIDSAIGFANYDIGHVVSTGGGGVAYLGCVCTSDKARGVTGSGFPVGDPFDIDYVAHEMGHQFGANHTFNANTGSCQGNRNLPTTVEPGSGTTIMAYAGICPGGNVQGNSDAYFHAVSINEMQTYITGTGCGVLTPAANTPPVIGNLPSYTIPKSTAFVLTGTATDAEGDALTYTWEQTNAFADAAAVPSATALNGPNFRSVPPSESPVRYFPEFQEVLNGNLTPTWEVVPAVGRTLSFAFTVRDNNANAPQTKRRNTSVTISNTAGPFAVTSQNQENIVWPQASEQAITWDVAGTTANGINTSAVNILLSTNGGQSFDYVLAANTPNDGTEVITVPDVQAAYCRIMVQPVDNVYYAVNAAPFSIGGTVVITCEVYENTTPLAIPDNGDTYTTSAITVPDGAAVTSVNIGVDITHTYVSDLVIALLSPGNTQVNLWSQQCGDNNGINVEFTDAGSAVTCANPTAGEILPAGPLSVLEGTPSGGTWTLGVWDTAAQDTGTLNSWYVEVCYTTLAPLSSAAFTLKDFMLYPNPGNGQFTVQFTADSNAPVAIGVHDMRGRQVFSKSYTSTGLFSQNVNLAGMQQGVYMVTVKNGERKEVRKVVIR